MTTSLFRSASSKAICFAKELVFVENRSKSLSTISFNFDKVSKLSRSKTQESIILNQNYHSLTETPFDMKSQNVRVLPPLELLMPISVPKKLLLGAGPANAAQRISDTASLPMLGHLHSEFLQLMSETRAGIQYAFQTKNEYTFAISGTGHAAMEAALCNSLEPGDSIVLVVNGHWGERAADMAERCGAKVHKLHVGPGEVSTTKMIEEALETHQPSVLFVCHGDSSTGVVHPLEGLGPLCQRHNCLFLVDCVASLGGAPIYMDDLEIDILYSGSQKVLNAPPGISPISFSNRAITKLRCRQSKVQSYYFDALLLGNYWGCDDLPPRYHHTGPISLVYALREALSILAEETVEVCWKRHAENAMRLQKGLQEMGLEILVKEPEHRLPTITTILVPDGVSDQLVAEYCMKKLSIEIARGLPPLSGKVWRVGLMGINSSSKNVDLVLEALKEAIQNTKGSSKV